MYFIKQKCLAHDVYGYTNAAGAGMHRSGQGESDDEQSTKSEDCQRNFELSSLLYDVIAITTNYL